MAIDVAKNEGIRSLFSLFNEGKIWTMDVQRKDELERISFVFKELVLGEDCFSLRMNSIEMNLFKWQYKH